jgi:exodeoxyribonuclease VII large subunit
MAAQRVYSVGQVNSYIKTMFATDYLLKNVFVRGEVSGCKYHTSGHIYFTLKDETGTLAAVMFAGQRTGLRFKLETGQKVIVEGTVSVYERDGRYQLYARRITQDGAGELHRRYEELKQRLEEMGMFDAGYKKKIPDYAMSVGVVTAQTSAAIRDIVNIASRRNPYVQLVLAPALVQGDGAADSIASALTYLDGLGLDVIIVGRGGGSMEDLWAFNEEKVARTIFECDTPVISAVGHETDVTIADFVADLRAPTPSAAAELAVFDIREFFDKTDGLLRRLNRDMRAKLDSDRLSLARASGRLEAVSPERKVEQMKLELAGFRRSLDYMMKDSINEASDYLSSAMGRLDDVFDNQFRSSKNRLAVAAARLHGLSPLKRLAQGYSYATDSEGRNIMTVAAVKPEDIIDVRLIDGSLKAEVIEVTGN